MKKKNFVVFIIFFTFIIGSLYFFMFITDKYLVFKLNGNKNIKVEVNEEYIDNGVDANIFGKSLKKYVVIDNNINNKKLGNYKITYSLKFLWINDKITRNVKVIDNIKPEIHLNGEETINLNTGDSYNELGANAKDNYDGDLTDKIKIEYNIDINKAGTYYVSYSIEDSSKNFNSIRRKVTVNKKINIIDEKDINNPIYNFIVDNKYDISVGYYNLINGKSYYYNENKVYFAASLIKTVEALYLYDNNMVNEQTLPYIEKAITISDNPSHHYLQNLIGQDNLKKYGQSLGAKYTLSGGGVCGNTTVKDQMIFLKRLYEITKYNNNELKSYFMNDYVNYIKFDDNIPTMHKYGYYDSVFHDVGIVFDKEPYIVVILTREATNSNIVTDLSKIIYNYHTGQ